MNEKHEATQKEIAGWCSTYGIVTAQRLLEMYKIKLEADDLIQALKMTDSFYHALLKIPMRNVFNGIIWQQAREYQIYAQKLFIDYLLSTETDKDKQEGEESPGHTVRADLEVRRQELIEMNDGFHALELQQDRLVARCQATILKDATAWAQSLKKVSSSIHKALGSLKIIKTEVLVHRALIALLSRYNFKEALSEKAAVWEKVEKGLKTTLGSEARRAIIAGIQPLSEMLVTSKANLNAHNGEVAQMSEMLREYRSDFSRFIIRTRVLFKLLPDYKVGTAQDTDNREALLFDNSIGEDVKDKTE